MPHTVGAEEECGAKSKKDADVIISSLPLRFNGTLLPMPVKSHDYVFQREITYKILTQEYEKQMKSFGIGMGSTPSSGGGLRQGSQAGQATNHVQTSLANSKKRVQVTSSQSMLESRYSKTFIYTPQAKEVKVKEVRLHNF